MVPPSLLFCDHPRTGTVRDATVNNVDVFFCLFVLSRPAGITFWRKSFAPETRHVAVDDRHGCQTRLVYQVNVVDFDCLCLWSPLSSALLPILLV